MAQAHPWLHREARRALSADRLLRGLFPKQREVHRAIQDGAKRIAVRCSRRSGKSYLTNSLLSIVGASKDLPRCLYLALTHDNVRRIAWDTVHRLDRTYDLGIKFNEAYLRCLFPRGGTIEYCGIGAGASGEVADRFRGASEGFHVVVIDEASKFRPAVLDYLIEAVVEPALMDQNGVLIMTGTPTPNQAGTFYQATSGDGLPGWLQFYWGAWDNPFMAAQWEAAVAEKRERNPRIDENAEFRREYFGEWISDATDLVYQLGDANLVDIAPPSDASWQGHVIGCDIGWNDSTAMCVAGWQRGKNDLWILESQKERRLLPNQIAERLQRLQEKYPKAPIVIDTGPRSEQRSAAMGNQGGRTVAAELGYRYGIPTIPTEKSDKPTWIKLLNSDLVQGRIHIVRQNNPQLLAEMRALPWQSSKFQVRTDENGQPIAKTQEDPGFANDCCDAMLYAYRYSWHYLERKKDFAVKSEEDKLFERHVLKRQAQRWR